MSDTPMNQATSADGDGRQAPKEMPPEPEQLAQQESQAGQSGVGAQLAAQREARGWTIEQVASQLNLAARQIQALEQDNYAALPGMASVRGFIRAYAKLLKIDATPLISLLATDTAPPPIEPLHSRRPLTAPFSDEKHLPSNGAGTPLSKPVVAAIGVAVLVAMVFIAYQFGWLQLPALPQVADKQLVDSSAPASAEVSAPAPIAVEVAPSTVASVPAPASSDANAPAIAAPAVASTPAVPVETPTERPAVIGKNTLMLKMREESWIEIRRGSETGKILLSRLERAGTTEAFEVNEPIAVTIGNVGGVEATLRGEPVNLTTAANSNVAHVTLK